MAIFAFAERLPTFATLMPMYMVLVKVRTLLEWADEFLSKTLDGQWMDWMPLRLLGLLGHLRPAVLKMERIKTWDD